MFCLSRVLGIVEFHSVDWRVWYLSKGHLQKLDEMFPGGQTSSLSRNIVYSNSLGPRSVYPFNVVPFGALPQFLLNGYVSK